MAQNELAKSVALSTEEQKIVAQHKEIDLLTVQAKLRELKRPGEKIPKKIDDNFYKKYKWILQP